jgi:hypothetical protein
MPTTPAALALRRDYAGWLAALADRIGLEGPSLELDA